MKRYVKRQHKAGRVLSAANATKLVTAVQQIQDVLTVAGIYDQANETESEDTPKGASQPEQQKAEPPPALTSGEDDELLKSFKALREAQAKLKEGVK